MESAGHLVALAPELAAGVEHREHDLGGREIFVLVVEADGDSPTIIGNLARPVLTEGHLNGRAVTSHCFVN